MSLVVRCSIDSAAGLGAASGGDTIVAQGEAVRDNLDAPCIGYHIDVQVCGCCGRPSWADASNSVVEGQGASGQDARGGTRGAVVTELVKLPPTAASARCEWDGEPQAAQQKDAKQRTGNGDVVPRWRDVENAGGEGPSLGQQQRTTGGCEVRKVHLVLALVASVGRESLPAFEGPTVAGGLFGGGGLGVRQADQSGASKPLSGARGPQRYRTGQDSLSAQRPKQTVSNGRRVGLDDGESLAPGGPVSGVTVRAGAALA